MSRKSLLLFTFIFLAAGYAGASENAPMKVRVTYAYGTSWDKYCFKKQIHHPFACLTDTSTLEGKRVILEAATWGSGLDIGLSVLEKLAMNAEVSEARKALAQTQGLSESDILLSYNEENTSGDYPVRRSAFSFLNAKTGNSIISFGGLSPDQVKTDAQKSERIASGIKWALRDMPERLAIAIEKSKTPVQRAEEALRLERKKADDRARVQSFVETTGSD